MSARLLGLRSPYGIKGGPSVSLWRAGPLWRRQYEVHCDTCGPVSAAPTSDIGWIRVDGHRTAHAVAADPRRPLAPIPGMEHR